MTFSGERAKALQDALRDACKTIHDALVLKCKDVLVDDRDERAGVKFKDAELLGMPTIVIVGKGLADGKVEVRDRRSGERNDVAVADAVTHVTAACRG